MRWDRSILPQILAHKDLAALLGCPAHLVNRVFKVTVDLLESRVHQGHLVPMVFQGHQASQVLMEIQGKMDHLGPEDNRAIRALEDHLVCQECRE